MIHSKKMLVIALAIPIMALATLTAYKKYVLSFGTEVVLPIIGYDPRDLLAGHYLIYRIDYGVENICAANLGQQTGYVCLEPKMFSFSEPDSCKKLIAGECINGRFEAGIEKYYVPQEKAKDLEAQVQSKTASIVLSLTRGGQAQVKDLLVDGQPWRK